MQPDASFLSDPQWILLQPLFALRASRGRPPSSSRPILENIFWKLTSNASWYDIPSESPSWQTCYHRYHRWKVTGVWKAMISTLMADLYTRGGIDLLKLWESKEIKFFRDCSGEFHFDYPPHLEETWQVTTTFLLLVLFASEI